MINGFHPPVRAARALFDDRDGAFGILKVVQNGHDTQVKMTF